MNYLAIARERWPDAVIMGVDGRYAVVAQNGSVIYLALTESQQRAIALGVDNAEKVDLKPTPFDLIPDRESHEERRQRRREARQQ